MQRLSYPTETVLFHKITMNRIVPSFKESHIKPLRRRPGHSRGSVEEEVGWLVGESGMLGVWRKVP